MVVGREAEALRVEVSPDSAGDVTRVLAQAGQWITELHPDHFSLEDVFLELTSSAPNDVSTLEAEARSNQVEEVSA